MIRDARTIGGRSRDAARTCSPGPAAHRPSAASLRHAWAILLATAGGSSALAEQLDDRYWVHLIGFRPSIESFGRSDFVGAGLPGTAFQFESELGLADRTTLPWFQAGARVGRDWRVELEYFSLRRSGVRDIDREIVWGEAVFPATATITTQFDSDVLRVSAGRSFVLSERSEIGVVPGLHLTRFLIGLSARTVLEGASAVVDGEDEEVLLPLPTVGVYGNHEFSRAWSVSGRFDWFSQSSGDYSGRLINALASLSYRFTDRIGVSLGYRLVDYSFEIARPTWRGGIDYRFSGPYLALRIGF